MLSPAIDYLPRMAIRRKPLEIPPAAARQFVADMQAYHAERNDIRRGA
jgi:hypothetical protein